MGDDGTDGSRSGGAGARRRPPGASDELVRAVGSASEALEYVERARGHLYSFHQLMGRADLILGDAADQLESCGEDRDAELLGREVVGRNVLDGRWTFQVVEEFDDLYYRVVVDHVRDLERRHMGGRRHVFESELKDRRRSPGVHAHDLRPESTDPAVGADDGP